MEEKTFPLGVFPLIPTEDLWTNQDSSGIEPLCGSACSPIICGMNGGGCGGTCSPLICVIVSY